MITLQCPDNPKQLGDTIDTLFLAHMISRVEECRVNVQISHPDQQFLNELVSFADVIIGKEAIGKVLSFRQNTEGFRLYHKYSTQINPIPRTGIRIQRDISLPDNFITTQWDATQVYRRVDKYDKERCNQIEAFYEKMGYDLVYTKTKNAKQKMKKVHYWGSKI